MKNTFLHVSLFIVLTTALGCAGIDINQYSENQPRFDLESYFLGQTKGWGIVQDRKGRLLRQFTVNIDGFKDEQGNLVLDESFDWSDGEKSKRIWKITSDKERRYSGEAADVIGKAEGVAAGNALNWSYDLELEVDGSTWVIHFDDWMFLQPDGILLNRAEMQKFGFRVGEVTIAFQKLTADNEATQ